jgi:uncharacterized membrane protein (UPF0127 family)
MPRPAKHGFIIAALLLVCLLLSPVTLTADKTWWKIKVKDIPIAAEIVHTDAEQQLGLGNRFSLPQGQGMLFYYERPGSRIFWMKNMNFSIDIIWFLGNKAVKIEENIPFPEHGTPDDYLKRYGHGVLSDMVLELPAGNVKKHKFSFGDSLTILSKN